MSAALLLAALAGISSAQSVLECPVDIVNVSAPVTLDATTAMTRFGVRSTAPAVTWGGGFQFRSLSFDSMAVSSAAIADCLFSQLSLEQQLASALPTSLNVSCAGVPRTFNLTKQAFSLVSAIAYGRQLPSPLAPLPAVEFPQPPADNVAIGVSAVVDIPPGDWSIAVFSDDGRILTLTGVTFLFRNASASARPDTLSHPDATASPVSYGTFTVAAESSALRSELAVFNHNSDGRSHSLALAIAAGHKTEFVASEFRLLRDNALGWRVRPTAAIPPLAEPTQFGCSAVAPATVHSSTVYAANSVGDLRNHSCAVRWRLVNATLHCPPSAVVRAASANGAVLTAIDVLGESANLCAAADIVIEPAQLTCATVGNPAAVTVKSMQQQCTLSVVLDDTSGFCATRTVESTEPASKDALSDTLHVDSTPLTWWMWWLIVSAIVFMILFVILMCCLLRRRQEDREQHSMSEFRSARESAEASSTRDRDHMHQRISAAADNTTSTPSPSSSRTYASTSNLFSSEYADPAGSKSTDYSGMPTKHVPDYGGMPVTDYDAMPPKSNYGGVEV